MVKGVPIIVIIKGSGDFPSELTVELRIVGKVISLFDFLKIGALSWVFLRAIENLPP